MSRNSSIYPYYVWQAIQRNETLGVLLALKDCSMNLPDKNGRTLLHHATIKGQHNSMQALITLGAKVNTIAKLAYGSPLLDAVFAQDTEAIDILLSAGADPLLKSKFTNAPIELAIRNNRADILKKMIEVHDDKYYDSIVARNALELSKSFEFWQCAAMLEEYIKNTEKI